MRMQLLVFSALCGFAALGGYQFSVVRAASPGEPFSEVLAAAGSEPGGVFTSAESAAESEDYRISALTVFSNVALHVKDNYVNPERINPKEMLVAALQEIEKQVAEVMVEDIGQGRIRVRVMNHEKIVYIDDVESLWEINLKLREVFRFFEKNLPPQKDRRAIEYAAVNGALSTLDPHSVLLKPDQFQEMRTSTKGEFGGLGIVISVRDSKLTIISPLDNTPASRAGLLALDVITRIGDVSTVSMPIEEAVSMLRGPEGSRVVVWIERKGWPEPRKYTLTRERIKIESVEARLLSDNVGYIKIKNFQQNTGKDLEDRLQGLSDQTGGKLKGVILDLRNNPGGLLEQAIRVSDKFLTSGDIVTTVGYGNKLREPKKARWAGTESELPLAVLVNNGSASASEIVAGALKNLDRAVIVGERTFGKGSVQVLYDFADNSALKLTIAQYLTPGGVSIQNVGVSPDIELKNAQISAKGVHLFYEPESHRENSLEKHLDRNSESAGGAVDVAPMKRITYLDEQEPPPADEGDEEAEAAAPQVQEDFPMRLARELLLAVGASSREKMLKSAGSFLDERDRQEQKRIEEKIQSLSIDWTDAPAAALSGTPKAEVEAKLLSASGKAGEALVAGSEAKLEVTVKNTGNVPFYRLHGVVDSEHPSFRGAELLFGQVAAKGSRTYTFNTRIPKDSPARSDLLRLRLEAAAGVRVEESVIPVVTRYVPHPHFSYSTIIDDSKRGDGDGILEANEGVDLVVLVTNTGLGDADQVWLKLKSGAGEDLYMESGRADLGVLKSGETKMGRLQFKVRKNQTPGKSGLPLELTIVDSGTNEWIEDVFSVVVDTRRSSPVARLKAGLVTKKDVPILAGADETSPVVAVAPRGAKLTQSGKAGELLRVDLDDTTAGWVRSADVKNAARPKSSGPLRFLPTRRPPSIRLDGELGESVVDRDQITLSGAVSGRALRDMYVLLNDDKVYFAPGPQAPTLDPELSPPPVEPKPAEWQEPSDQAVQLPFKVELPLKAGLNRVLVVARLDEKVVTYRSLFISRREPASSVVAEAPHDKKSKAGN